MWTQYVDWCHMSLWIVDEQMILCVYMAYVWHMVYICLIALTICQDNHMNKQWSYMLWSIIPKHPFNVIHVSEKVEIKCDTNSVFHTVWRSKVDWSLLFKIADGNDKAINMKTKLLNKSNFLSTIVQKRHHKYSANHSKFRVYESATTLTG